MAIKFTKQERLIFTEFLLSGGPRKPNENENKDMLWRHIRQNISIQRVVRKYLIAEFAKSVSNSLEKDDSIDPTLLNFEMEHCLLDKVDV